MLSDWSIYLIVLHMIGQMTERLHDMTSNRMLLDVVYHQRKKYNKHLILITL